MMKPCQNGGKCRSREVTKSPYYSCVCDAKWTGQNCQTKGTYSTLFTRIPNRQLSPCCCFFVSVLYSSFPPKVAPLPRKTGNIVAPPPRWGETTIQQISLLLPPKQAFSPRFFFVQILEKKIMESQSMLKSIFCTSQGY